MKTIFTLVIFTALIAILATISYLLLVGITDIFNNIFPEMLGMEPISITQMVLLIIFTIIFKKITL